MSSKKSLRPTRAKRVLALCSALAVTAGIFASSPMPQAIAEEDVPVYLDASGKYTFEERAADLVSRMTVEERGKQLDDQPPAIARLGLQRYRYWNEALHGIATAGATMFPSATGIAATWNRGIVGTLGDVIGNEARGFYAPASRGLTYWSPTLNIARDPRWGRMDESYGEDPYLVGQIGEQFVKGVQGSDPKYKKAISTPKHFFANNSESNRRNGNSVVTQRELREYYTPAFAHALSPEVGAGSYMTAYNRVNGVPMSASYEYLQDLAVRTWGFDGYVTSDCSAVQDSYNRHKWVPEGWDHAVDKYEAVAWTLKAGTTIDCQGNDYEQFMFDSYKSGYVTDADLDSELTKLLTARFKLGEFDPADQVPYFGQDYTRAATVATPENDAAALAVSSEAPILLKNNTIGAANAGARKGLPLTAEDASNLYVVGYMANEFTAGGYSGSGAHDSRSIRTGIEAVAKQVNPAATVTYNAGVTPGTLAKPSFRNVTFRSDPTTVIKTISASSTVNGYPLSITDNPDPDQFVIWEGWMGINWGYGDYMRYNGVEGGYVVAKANVPANTTHMSVGISGTSTQIVKGGSFECRVGSVTGSLCGTFWVDQTSPSGTTVVDLVGSYNGPTGSLENLYFVYNAGTLGAVGESQTQGHPYATTLTSCSVPTTCNGAGDTNTDEYKIRNASAVVVVPGTRTNESAEEMDRVTLNWPRFQDQMVAKVAAWNPHTVVYMQTVGQMNIEAFRNLQNVPSIVWSNYNGQYQGITAGNILFGKTNPSGKLPFTWYTNETDLANIWDYQITPDATHKGRTYQYFTGAVSYPFGHGLSYSNFQYSNLRINKTSVTGDDTITAQVDVTNASDVSGKEAVQLYVTAPGSNGKDRPKRQLKGFEKVSLGAYDTKTVSIDVKVSDLWFWDDVNSKAIWDKGTWQLQVGPKAGAGSIKTFQLTADPTPSLAVVATIADGTVLNTAAPNTVIHANLSASRNDQTFLDLSSPAVDVKYTSKNPAVAKVNADGIVSPVGVGVTTITATVTALGATKSHSFPVVVEGTDADPVVDVPDQKVELSKAAALATNAKLALVPEGATTSIKYYIQGMDENTAGATIDENTGALTATKTGKVRFTVLGDVDGVKVSQSAEIVVVPDGALTPQPAALNAAIAAAEALVASATPASVASSGLSAAIAAAKAAVAAATSQKDIDQALAALNAAVAAASGSLVVKDSPASRDALQSVLGSTITSVSALPAGSYTPASYAALSAAIANAKQVAANPNASLDQLQSAVNAVLSAVANLKSANATAPAPKVTTKSVTVTGKAFKKNTKPVVTVTVKLSKGVAKGKVAVYVGSKVVKTVNVSKAATSITLPAKYKKAISVKAQYKPAKANVNGTAKTSAAVKVKTK